MANGPAHPQHVLILNGDGGQNGKSPENRGAHECRESPGMPPRDVACRISRANPGGIEGVEIPRPEIAKARRREIATAALPPTLAIPGKIDAKRTGTLSDPGLAFENEPTYQSIPARQ